MRKEFDQMIECAKRMRDGHAVSVPIKELVGQKFPIKLEYESPQPDTILRLSEPSDYYVEHMRKVNAHLVENYERYRKECLDEC